MTIILDTYQGPGTGLGPGDTAVSEADETTARRSLQCSEKRRTLRRLQRVVVMSQK